MNVQTSELNKWEVCENMLPEGLSYSQIVTTRNRVYLLGGWNGDIWVSSVYSAPIDSEGVIGTWSKAASLPGPLSTSQAIVTKTRVYLLGGYNGGFIATVYSAPIDSEGVIGDWTTDASLPGPLSSSQPIVTKTRVYLLGGVNDRGDIVTGYSAPIDSEGVIGTWNPTADSSVSFTGIEEEERPDETESWTSLTDDLRMVKENLPNISLDSLRRIINIVKSDINNQNL